MAYVSGNPPTKRALRELVAARAAAGLPGVRVFQPGPFGPNVQNGAVALEGPHAPRPHRWYASCVVRDGRIVPGSIR